MKLKYALWHAKSVFHSLLVRELAKEINGAGSWKALICFP